MPRRSEKREDERHTSLNKCCLYKICTAMIRAHESDALLIQLATRSRSRLRLTVGVPDHPLQGVTSLRGP